VDQLEETKGCHARFFAGRLGDFKAQPDVALTGQVIDLGRTDLVQNPAQGRCIAEITVMKEKPFLVERFILSQMVNPGALQIAGSSDQAVDGIALLQKNLGEIRTVLAGDAGNESGFGRGLHGHGDKAALVPIVSSTHALSYEAAQARIDPCFAYFLLSVCIFSALLPLKDPNVRPVERLSCLGVKESRKMNKRHPYPFEKLNGWQSARELATPTYRASSVFPKREVYGLTSQCNRAAVSVAANIAEGSARQSLKDQAHFSQIAYGSLMELACLFIICKDVGILAEDEEDSLRQSVESVSAQLNALHRSQRDRI
jgi:four helix bundle protein